MYIRTYIRIVQIWHSALPSAEKASVQVLLQTNITMISASIRKDAKKHCRDVELAKAALQQKILQKMLKPLKVDDGLFPASVIQESVGYQAVFMDNMSCSIFNDLVYDNIPSEQEFYVAKQNGAEKIQLVLYTLAEQSRFWSSCFGKPFMKYAQNLNGERSCIFIAPMGMITKSFLDDDKYEREYKAVFDEKKWSPAFTNVEAGTGNLKCAYRGLNPVSCFVLDEYQHVFNGKKGIFYEVVVPDTTKPSVQLLPGVRFPGRKGIVPATCLVQRNSRLPIFQFTRCPTKLNKLKVGFRPMQVINNRLQWKIRPLGIVTEHPNGDEQNNTVKFEIPQGFKRFEGDMTEDFLDGGFLSVGQQHVYFKLFEDEWAHFKVLSFISPTSRPSGSLFSYKVKIIGKNEGTLPVFFNVQKYDPSASSDSEMGTWFIIHSQS